MKPREAVLYGRSNNAGRLPCGHYGRWRIYVVIFTLADMHQLNQCGRCKATWWLLEARR